MNQERVETLLKRAFESYQRADYNGAMKLICEVLRFHPDNYRSLYAAALALRALENHGLALLPARRCVELAPESPEAWNSLGMSFSCVGDLETATECFQRSIQLAPGVATSINNLGDAYMQLSQTHKALECFLEARKAVGAEDIMTLLNENEGHCRLALKEWRRGWQLYELGIGRTRNRKDLEYPGATVWNGKPTDRLVLWGEQGIGDEIMFASCIPDARTLAREIHIDTQKRLKGLFARSFPWATVHGTRADETRPWTVGQTFTSRCIFGSLPKFFRNQSQDFPGTPFLTADPQRRGMCRALLDGIGRVHPRRAKVGIAWSGGTMTTGRGWRTLPAEEVAALIAAVPEVDWISLEYDNPAETRPPQVHHFPFLTQTLDYDDTAALVAELDLVVSVQTAVVHLAGGLGKPCHVLVSDRPVWRYGASGERMPWYGSVALHRQVEGSWRRPLDEVLEVVRRVAIPGSMLGAA